MSTMAGPIAGRNPLTWPPDSIRSSDEAAAALLVDHLGIDAARWHGIQCDVVRLLLANKFAVRAVSSELLEFGALDGRAVRRIVEAEA